MAYCFYFQIYNAKDLAEEMAKIQTVLSDDKNDWEHRVAAVSLACVRTCTTVNPQLSPVLISNNPPSLPFYYSSLINDRLYQSITTLDC